MDVLKDRLYCDPKDSLSRRSAQTAMNEILGAMIKMTAPVLAHTAEEAWAAMKVKPEDTDTVHLASMPGIDENIDYKAYTIKIGSECCCNNDKTTQMSAW